MVFQVFSPLGNITPFTYVDGETYLERLSRLEKWIGDISVELQNEINHVITEFDSGLATAINASEVAKAAALDAESTANLMITAQDDSVAELVPLGQATTTALKTLINTHSADLTSDFAKFNDSRNAISKVREWPTSTKILGGNIVPAPGTWAWRDLLYIWDWEGWIKPQIDRARILGLNSIRLILHPSVVLTKQSTGGSTATDPISMDTLLAQLTQITTYIGSLGMTFYPVIVNNGDFDDINPGYNADLHQFNAPTNYEHPDVVNAVKAVAKHLAQFGNVLAFDVFQENGTGVLDHHILNMMAAIRSVAPGIPLTSSLLNNAWENEALPSGHMLYNYSQGVGSDFIDHHIYHDPIITDPDWSILRSGNRRMIIGEFGAALNIGATAGAARFKAVAAIHNRPGVIGSYVWGLADQARFDQPQTQLGVWDNTGWIPNQDHPDYPLVKADEPLSVTAGKRTHLTDVLTSAFNRVEQAMPRYNGAELLDEYERRPSRHTWSWAMTGGSYGVASHGLGMKLTNGPAAGFMQLDSLKHPVKPGTTYRATVETTPGFWSSNREVWLYILFYDAANNYVDQRSVKATQTANEYTPTKLDLMAYVDPGITSPNWGNITQARIRVTINGVAANEVHYLLDGASLRSVK